MTFLVRCYFSQLAFYSLPWVTDEVFENFKEYMRLYALEQTNEKVLQYNNTTEWFGCVGMAGSL